MSDIEDDGSAQRRRELVGALRMANFDISNLKLALGKDGIEAALTIKDLRLKVVRREEELRILVSSFNRSVGYKAPEVIEPFLWDFAGRVERLLRSWEDEDAAAAEVSGDGHGPAQDSADSGTSGGSGDHAVGAPEGDGSPVPS